MGRQTSGSIKGLIATRPSALDSLEVGRELLSAAGGGGGDSDGSSDSVGGRGILNGVINGAVLVRIVGVLNIDIVVIHGIAVF